jgi:hypothetical protein
MEHGQNNADKEEKTEVLEEPPSHSQCAHQTFKVDWPRSNPDLRVARQHLSNFQKFPWKSTARRSNLMVGRQGATVIEISSVTLALLPR